MKISVIFTGGTIGSSVRTDSVGIDNATRYMLLNKFEYDKQGIEFVTSSPYSVLSENLSAVELNLLQEEISRVLESDIDGIIVTHGTDTLQYSAAAIEYAFCDCNVPILFVSADYPLEVPFSNGYSNFEAAVEFIINKAGRGVFVSYKNVDESFTAIHIASRILQHRECSADLYSIDGKPYGVYDGSVKVNGVTLPDLVCPAGPVSYTDYSGILSVESCPGNNYSYSLDGVRAVVLKPYHSATLDTSNRFLREFCRRASDKGIPVFTVNVKPGIGYESTRVFGDLNIISLPYSTYVSVYMKLWIAVSRNLDIADYMQKPVSGEFV